MSRLDSIYILKEEMPEWLQKYFKNIDLISIEQLIDLISDLDDEIQELKIEKEERGN